VSGRLIVAIDGPSGAGKSTAGRVLARRLGYVFLDTGAMYRALALKALRGGVPLHAESALADLLRGTRIELAGGGDLVRLDGEDVSAAIRTREVSSAASRVSVHPAVRRLMVARQQEMGRAGGIVLDGRDVGTVVFPDADVKFYVDADPRRRAERRHAELAAAGTVADVVAIEAGDPRARPRRHDPPRLAAHPRARRRLPSTPPGSASTRWWSGWRPRWKPKRRA
jgi:cytidylate kinase